MFNNLIESRSHAKEFKRRGSFLLFTTATYLVLFVVTGVISIYAYDAHLESQTTELEILTFVPEPPAETPPEPPQVTIRTTSGSDNTPRSTRTVLYERVDNPTNPPETISTLAQPVPPATRHSVIGPDNVEIAPPPSGGRGVPGGTGSAPVVDIVEPPPPPPAPKPTPVKVIKISRVLNSEAIELPKPNYPMIAQQVGAQGTVSVEVLIDENGRVVSAKVLSGHPLLIAEARKAALRARFSPTMIGDQPVKVSGMINYNFVRH